MPVPTTGQPSVFRLAPSILAPFKSNKGPGYPCRTQLQGRLDLGLMGLR